MIYDEHRPYNPYGQALKDHFPNVARFVREMKAGPERDSFKRVARMERRAESNFVYDRVVKRIFSEKPNAPIWTIHDSILTVPAYQRYVKEVIKQEAGRLFGFVPQMEDVDYRATDDD